MNPFRPAGPRPGQPMPQNPLAPAHSMSLNSVDPLSLSAPTSGGVPSGFAGIPGGTRKGSYGNIVSSDGRSLSRDGGGTATITSPLSPMTALGAPTPGSRPASGTGMPGGMPGGFGGPPAFNQIPPALMQNPQFLQLLQLMMAQQRAGQMGGFSNSIFGRKAPTA